MSNIPSGDSDFLLKVLDCYFKKTYLKEKPKSSSKYSDTKDFDEMFWSIFGGKKK